MYNIVIASHGPFAEAMKNSVKLFFPDERKIATVSIGEKGLISFQNDLDKTFSSIKGQSTLFLVDLSYGTPFNEIAKRISLVKNDSDIIAGANMPTLIEAINLRNQGYSLQAVIPRLMNISKLQTYSEKLKKIQNNPEDE